MIGKTNAIISNDIEYPTLSNPATASDIKSGKQVIDGSGNVITGIYALPTLTSPANAANIQSGKQALDSNGNIVTGTHTERTSVTLSMSQTADIRFRNGSKFYTTVTVNIGDSCRIEVYGTNVRQGDYFNLTVS